MHKNSLYLVGGALLASTSLTAVGHAATIRNGTDGTATGAPPAATYTAKSVATQIFSATTTTANGVALGAGAVTANNEILLDIVATSAPFDVRLDISTATAAFTVAQPTLVFYTQSTTGSLDAVATSVTGCTAVVSAERLSLLNCNPAAFSGPSRIDAIGIRGVTYTSASALRTAGTSITLSGGVFQASTAFTFESITPAVVVTSKSAAASASVVAGTSAVIDNNAATAFTLLVSSGAVTTTTAQLGSVAFSASNALGADLSNAFSAFASIASTAEVKITHSVLTDAALTQVTFNNQTKNASDVVSGTLSFTITSASLAAGASIAVTFNGTTAISNTTGTPSATVTPTANATAVVAIPAFSGSLASFTRGGLSVELNTILPSAMKSSYISFLRIANQSSLASTATLVVRNDATGDVVGTITTASIPAGGVGQINSVDIDTKLTAAGVTPLTTASYKVTVSGNFNGYVQSLLYNVVSQVFADASGFRNGVLTTDP
jgi:hypothetical protein